VRRNVFSSGTRYAGIGRADNDVVRPVGPTSVVLRVDWDVACDRARARLEVAVSRTGMVWLTPALLDFRKDAVDIHPYGSNASAEIGRLCVDCLVAPDNSPVEERS